MATNWRSAYFEQAKSDYRLFLKVVKLNDVPLCQKLHYLQMTTEKMAKGFLTPPGGKKYNNTHNAFVQFVQVSGNHSVLRLMCNFTNKLAFNNYLKALGPILKGIGSYGYGNRKPLARGCASP